MWSPTHVQVIVRKAKNLRIKGKHGTNDTYVTIQLGKEKFQTSVQEKTVNPEWHEECELTIPDGNTSCITLAVFHRNFVGLDKFLGKVDVPLQELDVYERPRNKIYTLRGKSKDGDGKARGELEVCFGFVVKSVTGSLMDLSKKPKKSGSLPLKMVQSVGGSLMNLAGKDKRRSLSQLKNSISGKLSDKLPRKKPPQKNEFVIEENDPELEEHEQSVVGDYSDIDTMSTASSSHAGDVLHLSSSQVDFSSEPDIQMAVTPPVKRERSSSPPDLPNIVTPPNPVVPKDEVFESQQDNYNSPSFPEKNENNRIFSYFQQDNVSTPTPEKESIVQSSNLPKSARRLTNSLIPMSAAKEKVAAANRDKAIQEQNRINDRNKPVKLVNKEMAVIYDAMSKEELVKLMFKQRSVIERQQQQIGDLEDYIDNLLVRVMDTTPRILQNPYRNSNSLH